MLAFGWRRLRSYDLVFGKIWLETVEELPVGVGDNGGIGGRCETVDDTLLISFC
jgi:hypothetical protein